MLEEWGWKIADADTQLTENDARHRCLIDTPEASFELTDLPKTVLRRVAIEGWTRVMLRRESRGATSTKPWALYRPDFALHRTSAGNGRTVDLMMAVAAVPDWRTLHSPAVPCMCGMANPTREHWAWECVSCGPSFADLPDQDNLLSRRMCVPMLERDVPEKPYQWKISPRLAEWFRDASHGAKFMCGTDGGSRDCASSWGTACSYVLADDNMDAPDFLETFKARMIGGRIHRWVRRLANLCRDHCYAQVGCLCW